MKNTFITLALMTISATTFADTNHSGHSDMTMPEMDHATMDHSTMDMQGMSAVGMPAMGAKPDKVIHVLLSDDMSIHFKNDIKIEPNDVVQFVIMNTGKMEHEFSIGSASEQVKHREMMKTMDKHAHDSGSAVTLQPGEAKQLMWHFHGDKNVEFSCNIPDHAQEGMVKKVTL